MKEWQKKAVELSRVMSWRKVAITLEKSKSGVSDFLRKYYKENEVGDTLKVKQSSAKVLLSTAQEKKNQIEKVITSLVGGKTHIFIPDMQVKDDVPTNYLHWVGEYVAEKEPDVIVCAGDFADMPSLSSYDKGKKSAEGKRVFKDVEAAINGMKTLLKPLVEKQKQQEKEFGSIQWKPKMILTLGNHEERIKRHVEANAELDGFLSYSNLRYKDFGWEVYDYLEPAIVDGITYIHYFPAVMTGKPLGGNAANILKTVGSSVTMGHKQTLDVATRTLHNGKQQWAIVAGACYPQDEDYKGYVGNKHWRGLVVKHNVEDGSYDPLFVSLEYLKERYGLDNK